MGLLNKPSFVLVQHAQPDLYCASLENQQQTSRHTTTLRLIIILQANQSILSPKILHASQRSNDFQF